MVVVVLVELFPVCGGTAVARVKVRRSGREKIERVDIFRFGVDLADGTVYILFQISERTIFRSWELTLIEVIGGGQCCLGSRQRSMCVLV